jgi:hypothetical protein
MVHINAWIVVNIVGRTSEMKFLKILKDIIIAIACISLLIYFGMAYHQYRKTQNYSIECRPDHVRILCDEGMVPALWTELQPKKNEAFTIKVTCEKE